MKPELLATGFGAIPYYYGGIYMAAQTYDPLSASGLIAAEGTSFSTPLVAGAAALVLQAHPDAASPRLRQLSSL